jgi:chromosome segregation ATPase
MSQPITVDFILFAIEEFVGNNTQLKHQLHDLASEIHKKDDNINTLVSKNAVLADENKKLFNNNKNMHVSSEQINAATAELEKTANENQKLKKLVELAIKKNQELEGQIDMSSNELNHSLITSVTDKTKEMENLSNDTLSKIRELNSQIHYLNQTNNELKQKNNELFAIASQTGSVPSNSSGTNTGGSNTNSSGTNTGGSNTNSSGTNTGGSNTNSSGTNTGGSNTNSSGTNTSGNAMQELQAQISYLNQINDELTQKNNVLFEIASKHADVSQMTDLQSKYASLIDNINNGNVSQDLTSQINYIIQMNSELKKQNNELFTIISKNTDISTINDALNANKKVLDEIATTQNRTNKLASENNTLAEKLAAIQEENRRLALERQTLFSQLTNIQEENKGLNNKLNTLDGENGLLNKQLENLKQTPPPPPPVQQSSPPPPPPPPVQPQRRPQRQPQRQPQNRVRSESSYYTPAVNTQTSYTRRQNQYITASRPGGNTYVTSGPVTTMASRQYRTYISSMSRNLVVRRY